MKDIGESVTALFGIFPADLLELAESSGPIGNSVLINDIVNVPVEMEQGTKDFF